jgi:hypothetical protein
MNLMTLLLKIRSNKALLTRDVGRLNFNPKSKIQNPKSLLLRIILLRKYTTDRGDRGQAE